VCRTRCKRVSRSRIQRQGDSEALPARIHGWDQRRRPRAIAQAPPTATRDSGRGLSVRDSRDPDGRAGGRQQTTYAVDPGEGHGNDTARHRNVTAAHWLKATGSRAARQALSVRRDVVGEVGHDSQHRRLQPGRPLGRCPVEPPNRAGPRASRAPAVVPDESSRLRPPTLERRRPPRVTAARGGDERGGQTPVAPGSTPRTYPAADTDARRAARLAGRGRTAAAGSTAGDGATQQREQRLLPSAMPRMGIGPDRHRR
jgi:hypothetical protein